MQKKTYFTVKQKFLNTSYYLINPDTIKLCNDCNPNDQFEMTPPAIASSSQHDDETLMQERKYIWIGGLFNCWLHCNA